MNRAIVGHHGPSFSQVLLESLSSLRLLGRRSILALLGIAIGCASVVALLNIGRNATDEAMNAFKGLGANALLVSFPMQEGQNRPRQGPANIDIVALRAAVPNVEHVAPLIQNYFSLRHKGRSFEGHVVGTTEGLYKALGFRLDQGRLLSNYDDRATFAIAGASAAQELGLQVGSRVQVNEYIFEVVGIIQSKPSNPLIPVRVDETIFIPIAGMRRVTPNPEINDIIVWMRGTENQEKNAAALKAYLKSVEKGREVEVQVSQQLLEGLTRQDSAFSYLLGGLGIVSLLVGGVGIMNVMLMNVSERRREIGVRMAIGARPRDIRDLFLMEAAVLSVAGAVLGAVLGLVAAYAFVRFSGWAFTIALLSLPLGIFSSLIVGLFFGLYPAIAAARLQPVQALRDD
ncbi:MAG: ABC transporter permease [Betaproteobacteria bacterium]|nr:ABC transporter permease [Betaproteobacteria bacterium]